MSIPVLGDGDKQKEEKKRIERIAKGEVSGMKSARYTQEDESQLKSDVSKMNGKAMDKDKGYVWASGLVYSLASMRDAPYSAANRKYMRVMALNARMRIAYMRALAFASIKKYTE